MSTEGRGVCVCVCVYCICVCLCEYVEVTVDVCRGQKPWLLLVLELQTVVSCPM